MSAVLAAAKPSIRGEILSLLRKFLRTAHRKDPTGASGFHATVMIKYRTSCATVKRNEFQRIEQLLRQGNKQLKLFQMPGVSNIETR
ncbi:hypothetical protein M885DRAFT_550589 [Pelagophyceae sp. CCMP2097]|nr:hypothetical protein M885DRAFT_550589 [Pelagophyceae sp. CCMP2097]